MDRYCNIFLYSNVKKQKTCWRLVSLTCLFSLGFSFNLLCLLYLCCKKMPYFENLSSWHSSLSHSFLFHACHSSWGLFQQRLILKLHSCFSWDTFFSVVLTHSLDSGHVFIFCQTRKSIGIEMVCWRKRFQPHVFIWSMTFESFLVSLDLSTTSFHFILSIYSILKLQLLTTKQNK